MSRWPPSLRGPDYLANLGRPVAVIAAILLTPFAGYFLLVGALSPLASVLYGLVEQDWNLAGMLFLGGSVHGLVGVGLGWFAWRLFAGNRSSNGLTVLPSWMIWAMLLALIPFSIATAAMLAILGARSLLAGDWAIAAFCGVIAVGFLIGLTRTIVAFWKATKASSALSTMDKKSSLAKDR